MLNVSVVIPVKNAARTLPGCLAALTRLDPRPTEVLLVDNGSIDASLALMQAFAREHDSLHVTVLTEPTPGASRARNTGIRAARGEVVAFIDADCQADIAWLHHLTAPFSDPSVGAVAGKVAGASASSTLELFSMLYTFQLPNSPVRHDRWTPWAGGYPTANLAVRRHLLEQLRGFDERIRIYGEDYDLCARLYKKKVSIAYTPDAQVLHHHRTTLPSLLRQAFGFGRSHPYLLRRHASAGLWLDLPLRSFVLKGYPIPTWVDLASADKKVIAILLVGALYQPVLLLLPFYWLWLMGAARNRGRAMGAKISGLVAASLAGLLLCKSLALTLGRWWGSVRYGAVCV